MCVYICTCVYIHTYINMCVHTRISRACAITGGSTSGPGAGEIQNDPRRVSSPARANAAREDRTRGLRIMRPTRCQLHDGRRGDAGPTFTIAAMRLPLLLFQHLGRCASSPSFVPIHLLRGALGPDRVARGGAKRRISDAFRRHWRSVGGALLGECAHSRWSRLSKHFAIAREGHIRQAHQVTRPGLESGLFGPGGGRFIHQANGPAMGGRPRHPARERARLPGQSGRPRKRRRRHAGAETTDAKAKHPAS